MEKYCLIKNIKDFNYFVDCFRKKYKRDPIDDEELHDYIEFAFSIKDLERYVKKETFEKY